MGPLTIMRRAVLYFYGKNVKVFILSSGCAVPSSLSRSKIAGYAAKESVLRCLLHISKNVEADIDVPSTCDAIGGMGGR